jgi:16S rRNA (uracil1498-N3)-methyltransferase
MRKKVGDEIILINGVDGEFLGKIIDIKKKSCDIEIKRQTKEFKNPQNLCLAFGLIKRIEFVAEKGTELGVTEFLPLITQRTIIQKFNKERFEANVIEAVEQSERLDLPKIHDVIKIQKFITSLCENDYLIFCEERSGNSKKAYEILLDLKKKISEKENKKSCGKIYIVVGPEGGFSEEEIKLIKSFKNTYSVSLGEGILRAETATIVILGLVNDVLLT